MNNRSFKVIAKIHTDFHSKFGIPRQSGLIPEVLGEIIFEPKYRDASALKGLEEFTHLWLLWEFSESVREDWSPTVRPPRLGGNERKGVFATRSPFRPNPVGLSCVKIVEIKKTVDKGMVIIVSGADLLDGTPIYDIKPYIPYTDCHPEAAGGFSERVFGDKLEVAIPEELSCLLSGEKLKALKAVLSGDPRPAYHEDEEREYGFEFSSFKVKFRVKGDVLTVTDIYNVYD